MKVFDYSPIPFNGGKISVQDRMKGITKFGTSWVSEMKSQEVIIEILSRILDNRFTLLRNIRLPRDGTLIPLVLLGSHGVTLINNCIVRGIYNADGDVWKKMDEKIKDYKPSKPNFIQKTSELTQKFGEFLFDSGSELEIDDVLVFSDPGTHVSVSRKSSVRIILMDAIDRFGAGLLPKEQILSMEEIRNLIVLITEALQPVDEEDESRRIIPFEQYSQFAQNVDSSFMQAIAPIQEKSRFSKRQWVLLWLFAIVDILILIGFVIYILSTA